MNSTLLFGASDLMESAAVSSTFLAGFIASSLMIFSSELADKSFFIAVIMAANYNSLIVFLGSAGALTTMSVISVVIGRVLMKFIWPEITSLVCACLFTVFGVLSIKEACDESSKPKEEGEESEENEGMAEAREALVRRNTENENRGIKNASSLIEKQFRIQLFTFAFLSFFSHDHECR